MEEKEKECTGRDQCGTHTHSRSLSLSLSPGARLARSHAWSPGARRIPSGAEKLYRLLRQTNCFGKCVCSRSRGACGILSSRLNTRELGPSPRPGLSTASATIAAATANEAPRPGACGGLETLAGLPPLDAWPTWFWWTTPASWNGSSWGPIQALSANSIPPTGRSHSADPGIYKAGAAPARAAMRVGPVRFALSGASQPRGPGLLFPAARGTPAKRLLDTDDAGAVAAKCPRLSECSSPPDYLSPPGSPCSPQPPPSTQGTGGSCVSSPGPSRIADYLLLPLAEREHVSRALCIHTGRELRCKVSILGRRLRVWIVHRSA